MKIHLIIFKVNETEYEEHKLPCMDFYIPEITEKVDIRLDYINWFGRPRIVSHILEVVIPFSSSFDTSFCDINWQVFSVGGNI